MKMSRKLRIFAMLLVATMAGGLLAGGVAIAQGKTVSHVCLANNGKVKKAGDDTLKCSKKLTKVAISGTTGARGVAGTDGADGARGARGTAGADGEIGPKGDIGKTGKTGATGSKGDTGKTGSKGDTGKTGAIGATGKTGATGGPASYYTAERTTRAENGALQIDAIARCDSGDVATGGGFTKSVAGGLEILISAPSGDAAWLARAQATSAGFSITAWVICADL